MNLEILNKYLEVYCFKASKVTTITYFFLKNYNKYITIINSKVFIVLLPNSFKKETIEDDRTSKIKLDTYLYNKLTNEFEVKIILDKIIIKHKLWNYMKN